MAHQRDGFVRSVEKGCVVLPNTPDRPHVRVAGLQTKFLDAHLLYRLRDLSMGFDAFRPQIKPSVTKLLAHDRQAQWSTG
jgi:hypothetical protein